MAKKKKKKKQSRKVVPIGCPPGEILIRREAYTRSDGTRVGKTQYCADDRGRPGVRSFGAKSAKGKYAGRADMAPLISRKGKLGGAGYTKRPIAERHEILRGCVEEYGYRSCLGSLQVMLLGKTQRGKARKVFQEDKDWLVRTFGGPGSFGPRQVRTRAVAANPGDIKRLKNRCL